MPIDAHRYETERDAQTYRLTGGDVSRGDAVKLVGEMTVAPTDTDGEAFHGVTVTSASVTEDGEVGVYTRGLKRANVTNPDGGTVAHNTYLTPSGTANGVLRPLNTNAATGETQNAERPYKTLTAEDADGQALVDLG